MTSRCPGWRRLDLHRSLLLFLGVFFRFFTRSLALDFSLYIGIDRILLFVMSPFFMTDILFVVFILPEMMGKLLMFMVCYSSVQLVHSGWA